MSEITKEDLYPSYEERKLRTKMFNEMNPAGTALAKGLATDVALGTIGSGIAGAGGKAISKSLAKTGAKIGAKGKSVNKALDRLDRFTDVYADSIHGQPYFKSVYENAANTVAKDQAKLGGLGTVLKYDVKDKLKRLLLDTEAHGAKEVSKQLASDFVNDTAREAAEHVDDLVKGKSFQYFGKDAIKEKLSDAAIKNSIREAGDTGKLLGLAINGASMIIPGVSAYQDYKEAIDSYGGKESYKNRDKEAIRQKYMEDIKQLRNNQKEEALKKEYLKTLRYK